MTTWWASSWALRHLLRASPSVSSACGIPLEQGQIPGAKQKIALLYGKDADFPAVLSKAAALRDTYNVTVLQQAKKLGKQLGQLEAAGFAGAAFMDKDEVKIFAQQ